MQACGFTCGAIAESLFRPGRAGSVFHPRLGV